MQQSQMAQVKYLPLYQQVRQQMLHLLADSTWRAGELLPTEFELAERFGVSQGTARKALNALVREGVLTRRQGVGTFVADWPEEWTEGGLWLPGHEFANLPDRLEPELLSCGRAVGSERVVEALGLKRNAQIVLIRRLWRLSGQLVAYDEIALDAVRFDRLDARLIKQHSGRLLKLYLAEFGLRISRQNEWFLAMVGVEEGWIRFTDAVPVLRIERSSQDVSGQVFEWRRIWVDSRRCIYRRNA